MAVVGKHEAESEEISLRKHRVGDMGKFSIPNAIDMLKSEETERKIDEPAKSDGDVSK
jgi:threonyl-tRNA synthetase